MTCNGLYLCMVHLCGLFVCVPAGGAGELCASFSRSQRLHKARTYPVKPALGGKMIGMGLRRVLSA